VGNLYIFAFYPLFVKALILAGGMGTRMRELTRMTNKCCLRVGDQSLVKRVVTLLQDHQIQDIKIITGHCAERVHEEVGPQAHYIFNPLYHSIGILFGVWLAKDHLNNEPFVLSTADHFFHPQILEPFLNKSGDVIVAVKRKHCTAEDVKVVVEGDHITLFEEDIPAARAVGEFGMLVLFNNPTVSRVFFQTVEQFLANQQHKSRLIDALNNMIQQGYVFTPYFFDEHLGVEVDTYEDLEKARQLDILFKEKL